ncbi:MAG: hypothetical protein HDR88_04245 [Bacteroides sp.]|nr:hypothetical protein [Bacteroides sp.]
MNIKQPKTFSEKLQWLKKNGPRELKTRLADKYEVREWVKEKIGKEYLVDLLPLSKDGEKAITKIEDIDFDQLPNEFVLKLTKGSGFNIICNNKDKLDITKTKKTLADWLKINNYYLSREPQYKGENKIICEKMLEYNITDYKFFCFNGQPTFVELYIDRFGCHRKVFYDMDWQKVGFTTANDSMEGTAIKPKEFDEMVSVAKELSKGWTFVRVDLYVHDGKVYFGEMTFHPAGGYTPITPREWEYKLGEKILL